MGRSLASRITLVILAATGAAWLAMALGLIVVLSGLEADATKSSLADIGQTLVVRFRDAALDRDLRTIVTETREAVAGSDISIHILRADGSYADLGGAGGTSAPSRPVAIPDGAARGMTVTGSVTFDDGETHLYAATVLRAAGAAGPRAIVLSQPDRSRAAAVADLTRTLPLLILVSGLVGIPLALWLSRSVARPLRQLSEAAARLPATGAPEPLPLEGPTEVRELTATFNAMAAELVAADRRESALLADLRHDLRTPLTVITGYAAALADGTAVGDDATRAARAIEEETARLERLIGELGDVARLRTGGDALRPESLDARMVVAGATARFTTTADAAGVVVSVVDEPVGGGPDPEPLPLVADRAAIDRVLANLVANALAVVASPGGRIWLAATNGPSGPAGSTVVLSVTDDGPGFPPGSAAHVFERFYRADPARSGPGSGLGLAIARELVEAHGGSIIAENVAPHGARVSVTLPTVPPAR